MAGIPLFAAWLFALLPQGSTIPFDDAGKQVLELVDRARPKNVKPSNELRQRLEPLHERVRLGGLELWVPKRALNEKLAAKDGPSAKEVQAHAAHLVALQREWLPRVTRAKDELAAASSALDVLERWTREFRGGRFPEARPEITAARQTVERLFFRRALADGAFAPIAIVAPTRAQFIGTIGAATQVDPTQRPRLHQEANRRATAAHLAPGCSVVAWTSSPEHAARDPLRDEAIDVAESDQNFVHTSAHLLSIELIPMAPGWWLEGLALCDTIALCRADETVCTGHADMHASSSLPGAPGALGILLWVTRHKSPFRDTFSPAYFAQPLRAAWAREGLQVFDLDKVEPVSRVEPPLLGRSAGIPSGVANGTDGAKRGFAELYRAYCAGFVHWLDQQRSKDEQALLDVLCAELARHPYDPQTALSPLYDISERLLGRSLGASNDPELDLEAAFVASLAAR